MANYFHRKNRCWLCGCKIYDNEEGMECDGKSAHKDCVLEYRREKARIKAYQQIYPYSHHNEYVRSSKPVKAGIPADNKEELEAKEEFWKTNEIEEE